jgi:hypothetical protein
MNELIEYVRNRKGQRIGVVMAKAYNQNSGGMVKFGWSKANVKMGDSFDKEVGLNIARGRADTSWPTDKTVPYDVLKVYNRMLYRSAKYFKGLAITTK